MSGSTIQPTGVPPELLAAACPAAFNAVKNCATQPLFCMLFQAALTPSMLPFMPYSTSTGVMPNRLALLSCGVVPAGPTRSRSTFGPPEEVVAVARTLLAPAFRLALKVWLAQVSQFPVGLKARPAARSAPLTLMSIGRLAVLPLA